MSRNTSTYQSVGGRPIDDNCQYGSSTTWEARRRDHCTAYTAMRPDGETTAGVRTPIPSMTPLTGHCPPRTRAPASVEPRRLHANQRMRFSQSATSIPSYSIPRSEHDLRGGARGCMGLVCSSSKPATSAAATRDSSTGDRALCSTLFLCSARAANERQWRRI